jgi:iron complex transport system ATP-binding protein
MVLSVEDVSFAYPRRSDLIKGITFSVDKGDVLCLLGPNGTGKTTLLRCLLGINKIKRGGIRIGGRPISEMSARELARQVAYVPQAASVAFPYQVLDLVLMGRSPHLGIMSTPAEKDLEIAGWALARTGISHLQYSLFSEISGGERQLVLISRALAQQSGLLIMDEPTASLDYGNQTRILKIIRELAAKGYTIIMTTHFPNHAFLACNKAAIMKEGIIAAIGSPEEVITDDSLSDLYTTEIKVVSTGLRGLPGELKVCVPLMPREAAL